jgi:cysteine desulfurase
MRTVYLDNHSGRPLDERVYEAMLPFLKEYYGNAQSMHSLGAFSRDALEQARSRVAGLINVRPEEVFFTSCGSEANNLALKGIAQAYVDKGKHLILSEIEHVSVINAAKRLAKSGFAVTTLPVDRYGLVDPEQLKGALRSDTILVSIQHANPEIGSVQDIADLVRVAHERGALFHTDAVSSCGIIETDAVRLGVDLLTLSGSQIYGPRGAAALYVKKGLRLIPQIDGGIQENNRRAGTENIPALVGLGRAAEIARLEREENRQRVTRLRNRLIRELPAKIEHLYLNGHPERRLPDNVNYSVEFIEGEGMLLLLDGQGIFVTSGSACTSKTLKMSHILAALKLDAAVAQGSVTMTLSRYTTDADIDHVLAVFPGIVKSLRDLSPLYAYFIKTGQRQEAGPGTDYEHDHGHDAGDNVCESP